MEQEIQEAKSLYYSYKQYFSDYLPALTKLGLKVVMALLVFVGGRKVIQWFVSFIKNPIGACVCRQRCDPVYRVVVENCTLHFAGI